MKIITLLTFVFLTLFCFSCQTNKKFSELTPDDILINMSKGACFGTCPSYDLTIYDGGYVHFNGRNYTTKDGKWIMKLDKSVYKTLISDFKASNFEQFQDQYESELADLQMVRISYLKKTVAGKDGRPEAIYQLQKKLESIVNIKVGWTQIEAAKNKSVIPDRFGGEAKAPEYIFSEIILEPKPGAPLSKILINYREKFGLRLLKKVSPNSNLWLVSFDTNKNEPKIVLDVLKKDAGIKHAEFNVKTKLR